MQRVQHSTITTSLFRRPSQTERDEAVKKRGLSRIRASAKSSSISRVLRSESGDSPEVSHTLPGRQAGARGSPRAGDSSTLPGKSPARQSPFRGSGKGQSSFGEGALGGASSKQALHGLTGTVEQLRLGSELNQAQLKAMFDRMCELSAQVDALKGQVPA